MTPSELMKLKPGTTYFVHLRKHDLRAPEKAKTGKWPTIETHRVRRKFLGLETRLGEIPCANFSTRITRRNPNGGFQSYLSIPHYDLLSAVEPA